MDALTRELRRQLSALDPAPAPRPKREPRAGVVVRYSVRRPDGGQPFLFEYKAAPGTWRAVAEHDAKAAIVRAGLRPWVHLETLEG
jgi:hypothetical protein